MTPLQRYTLSPVEKWRHFGEWPWQLTWHLALLALATYQVVVASQLQGVSRRAVGMHFAKALYPDNWAALNGDAAVHPWRHYYLFTWDDLRADMTLALQRYYALPTTALTPVRAAVPEAGAAIRAGAGSDATGMPLPTLEVQRWAQPVAELWSPSILFSPAHPRVSTVSLPRPDVDVAQYLLQNATAGPPTHGAFMAGMSSMTLAFTLDVHSAPLSGVGWNFAACQRWRLALQYRFPHKGQVAVMPGYNLLGPCNAKHLPTGNVSAALAPSLPPLRRVQPGAYRRSGEREAARRRGGLRPARRAGQALAPNAAPPSPSPVPLPLPHLQTWAVPSDAEQAAARAGLLALLALTLLASAAHEYAVLMECAGASALVRGLARRSLGLTGPRRRPGAAAAAAAAAGEAAGPRQRRRDSGASAGTADSDGALPTTREGTLAWATAGGDTGRWDEAGCGLRCTLLRGWMVVASLGDAAFLAYMLWTGAQYGVLGAAATPPPALAASPAALDVPRVLLGTGTALLWLSLLQYLEHVPRYYSFILTLQRAMPRLLRFLASVVPLFIGWGVFGMVMFGSYAPRWADRTMTFITLFAYVNGDAMQETFSHTRLEGNGFLTALSEVYLYLFIFLFMYVVLNVFIAINEEAFFASRPSAVIDVNDGRQLPIMLRSVLQAVPLVAPYRAPPHAKAE